MGTFLIVVGCFCVLAGCVFFPAGLCPGLFFGVALIGLGAILNNQRDNAERVVALSRQVSAAVAHHQSFTHWSQLERRIGDIGFVARLRWHRAMTGNMVEMFPLQHLAVGLPIYVRSLQSKNDGTGKRGELFGEELVITDQSGRAIGFLPEPIQATYLRVLRGVYTDREEIAAEEDARFWGRITHVLHDPSGSRVIMAYVDRAPVEKTAGPSKLVFMVGVTSLAIVGVGAVGWLLLVLFWF
jgi:hypothetical protein